MKRLLFPIAALAIALIGCAVPDDTAANNDAKKAAPKVESAKVESAKVEAAKAEPPSGEDPNTMSLAGFWRATHKGANGEQVVKLRLEEGGNATLELMDASDATKSNATSGHFDEIPNGVSIHFHGADGKDQTMKLELSENKLKTTEFDIAKWGGDGLSFERETK